MKPRGGSPICSRSTPGVPLSQGTPQKRSEPFPDARLGQPPVSEELLPWLGSQPKARGGLSYLYQEPPRTEPVRAALRFLRDKEHRPVARQRGGAVRVAAAQAHQSAHKNVGKQCSAHRKSGHPRESGSTAVRELKSGSHPPVSQRLPRPSSSKIARTGHGHFVFASAPTHTIMRRWQTDGYKTVPVFPWLTILKTRGKI